MCDKKEQALGHIKEAEKHLKTGFLKWKPDLDLAADEFNKAATCYRVVGAHDECRQCLTRCAACHTETGSLFAAGRCYEQAALMSKELNQLATVANLTARAADLYQQQGSHDAALRCLEKGGAMLEQKDPDGALAMFQRAAEVVLIDERHREAAGLVSKVSRLLVRLARYDEALASVRKEMDFLQEVGDAGMQNRLVVVLVLLQLARDDVVAARLTFNQWSGVCEPQELSTLSQLLEGFEEGDGDMAARALAAPFIRHMDVEYSRLAASLQPPASNNCQANTDVGTAAAKGSSAEIVFVALLAVAVAERRYSAPRVVLRRVYEEPREEVVQRYEAPREEVRTVYEAPEEREEVRQEPSYGYSAPVEEKKIEEPIAILRHSAELRDDHSYDMQFETENGIKMSESGRALPASDYDKEGSFEVAGEYSYVGADGRTYKLVYVADENGFQAKGDHLPTPVPTQYPTPDPSDDGDDGSYRAEEVKVVYEEPAAPVRSYSGYN